MVLSIGGSYNYQSSYAATDYFDPFVKVDSHSLVNGDVGISNLFRPGLDLSVFAKNLLKEKYYEPGVQQYGGPASLGVVSRAIGEPRTFGVSRSEARRVGKECVSTCRSRWLRFH